MDFVYKSQTQIDDLLNRIGEKLQLNPARHQRAEASYQAVGDFINSSGPLFEKIDSEFYPQGSFAIQTTTKPLHNEEYDLDGVLEMQVDFNKYKPSYFLDALEEIFHNSPRYASMCERKNRCIRLNYANEFHLDILPGCPDYELGGTNLRVPDSETKCWIRTNPIGYIGWFEARCQERILAEKMAQIYPVPSDLPYELKPPLKRGVQLMKRFRDVYFNGTDGKPRSIVITTLAGQFYSSESSVFQAISNSLRQVNQLIDNTTGILELKNPANGSENLGDRWQANPEEYDLFRTFYKDFELAWSGLRSIANEAQLTDVLATVFGEDVSREVIKEADEYQRIKASQRNPVIITTPSKPWSTDELVRK